MAAQLPKRFWLMALIAFVINMMLRQYEITRDPSAPPEIAARYVTYYFEYVVLGYLTLYLGHKKIGSKRTEAEV